MNDLFLAIGLIAAGAVGCIVGSLWASWAIAADDRAENHRAMDASCDCGCQQEK